MKKLFPLFVCALLLMNISVAQNLSLSPVVEEQVDMEQCGTMAADAALRAQNPGMGTLDDFEVWLQEEMQKNRENPSQRAGDVYRIPVVIHVIHNGDPIGTNQNISSAQVLSQLDVLNEDFRRVQGTPGFNTDSVGADAEIEFCLAILDPMGQPMGEDGVNRIDRNVQGWNPFPFNTGYMDGTIKPATIWDPNVYFNIWAVPLPGGLLGYAQFPEGSGLQGLGGIQNANTDGIVVTTRYFGNTGNIAGGVTGRTATHEAGHFFGLRHIWGDGGCGVDDFCGDTPTSDASNGGCNTAHVSCGTVDMVQNYMDYSGDNCMNIFTQCQVQRMRTVLQNSPRRLGLLTSGACAQPTGPPITAFSVRDTFSCDGRVEFFDESDPFATNWFWVFSNGEVSTQRNPIITFDSSGTYTATLVSNNFLGSGTPVVQSFNIVIDPIGTTSAGADVNACLGTPIQLGGSTQAINPTISWFPAAGLDDPTSLTPVFTGLSPENYILTVTSENGCSKSDTVNVTVNPSPTTLGLPIGGTTILPGDSVQLNALGASAFLWNPPAGLSNQNIANPWAKPAVTTIYTVTGFSPAGCSKSDEVIITVEGTTGLDERLFSDVGVVHPAFPNPSNADVTFAADMNVAGNLRITLKDLTGRAIQVIHDEKVASGSFSHTWQRDMAVAQGVYIAIWEMEGKRYVQKIELY